MKKGNTRHIKLLAQIALPFLCCIFIFIISYLYYLTDVPLKHTRILLNDDYTDKTSAVTVNNSVTQEITIDKSVFSLGVVLLKEEEAEGNIHITVKDAENDTVYATGYTPISAVSDTYFSVNFDTAIPEERRVKIEITSDTEAPAVTIAKTGFTPDKFGSLTYNGKIETGAISVELQKDLLGNLPVYLYAFIAVILSAMASVLLVILSGAKTKKAKAIGVFLLVLTVGIGYQAVLPSFAVPDELSHYNTSYNLSSKILGKESVTDDGIYKRSSDIHGVFEDEYTTGYTYKYYLENLTEKACEEELSQVLVKQPYLLGYKLPRLLPAIAISICRLLKVNGLMTATISRFAVLVFFAFSVAVSYFIIPDDTSFGVALVALALLPISMHIGGSFSYDSTLISLAYMIIALYINCIYSETISDKKLILLAILCVAIAPLKSAYFTIILLVCLLPKEKFKSSYKHAKLIILALSFLHFAVYNLSFLKNVATTTDLVPVSYIYTYSILYVLKHPVMLMRMVMNTFFRHFTFYFMSLFGGTLGYFEQSEVTINTLIVLGFIVVILLAFIRTEKEHHEFTIVERVVFGLIFIGTLGMLVAACITWTPSTYDYIWGFQSRYLLPVLPLAMMQLNSPKLTKKGDGFATVLYTSYVLNVLAIINSFVVILLR